MPPIGMLAVRTGDMALRETGDGDAEITRLADEPDELGGKLEAAGDGLKRATTGRIAPQRQDVLAAQPADLVQQFPHLLAGVTDAGEMRQSGQPLVPLNPVHDPEGLVACAASGAVGDGTEVRFGLQQRGNVFFQKVLLTLAGFGREKFKGNDGPLGRSACRVNIPNQLHLNCELSKEVLVKPSLLCRSRREEARFKGRMKNAEL